MPGFLRGVVLLIGFVAALAGCAAAAPAESMPRFDQHGPWLLDEKALDRIERALAEQQP